MGDIIKKAFDGNMLLICGYVSNSTPCIELSHRLPVKGQIGLSFRHEDFIDQSHDLAAEFT